MEGEAIGSGQRKFGLTRGLGIGEAKVAENDAPFSEPPVSAEIKKDEEELLGILNSGGDSVQDGYRKEHGRNN